ncbi:MAG: acylating sulfoacetaldehyde dehydrogenase [Candidatus Puniceispirillaceae bacterium]
MSDLNMIDDLVARAKRAQSAYEARGDQAYFDKAAKAVAWALMEPSRNRDLATKAVAQTELGNVADKIQKNHRKTLGLLHDLKHVKSFGHISDDAEKGLSIYYRPKGVVAAIVPSTNPLATPVNNAINAMKTGNAIILAPSPKGANILAELLSYIHAEFDKCGIDRDLVQMIPNPPSKDKTNRLMALADVLVVTGSQNNVRSAYASGTPAIGVGMGNVVTIIDETADYKDAADKICRSKTFDNATSCSSENAVIALKDNYQDVQDALQQAGGYLLSEAEVAHLEAVYFGDGKMHRGMIAQDFAKMIDVLGFSHIPKDKEFLIAPTDKRGKPHKISGEKMALFLAIYQAADFDEAAEMARQIQDGQGAGHSIGLHSKRDDRAHHLALKLPTCRVIVNQAHCFANGGSFDNGLPFSLSMGCGSWGGNSIDENFNWRHLVNQTVISRPIPAIDPDVDDLFADYDRS